MKASLPPVSLRAKIAASILLVLIVGVGGFTYLSISHEETVQGRLVVIMAAALTLLAAFSVIWVLLSHWVTRPIRSLVDSVARVERGDFSARALVLGGDEFGKLARNFNTMVERLAEAQGELERYHDQRMERAEALANLGELAAGLAHEIKNPLAGIAGAMQILSSDLAPGDPKREVFEEIAVQVRRIEKTVTDLLSFARPQRMEFSPVNLNEVTKAALFLVRQHSEAKQITFQEDLAPTLPMVHADPRQIQQVFLNLILNAVQAMPGGGKVTVRTQGIKRETPEGPRSVVQIEVEDTGPGIPEDVLTHIFEPFFTTKHKGTGLGLAIVRRIVSEHSGEIKVKTFVGRGTTFTVALPEAEEPDEKSSC